MITKKSFGEERKDFNHYESVWGSNFIIYPEIPLKSVLNLDLLKFNSTAADILLESSINYVVCDKNGNPLFFLDFCLWNSDLNNGFKDYKNVLKKERKDKIKLKLDISRNNNIPFHFVSFEEPWEYLPDNSLNENGLILTIIDSIIGETLIKKDLNGFLENLLEDLGMDLNAMNQEEKKQYLEDLISNSPLELKWDPLVKKIEKIHNILLYKGIIKTEFKIPLSIPELPLINDLNDELNLQKRRKIFQRSNWHGSRISCKTDQDNIQKEAWIRNFEDSKGSTLIITQNIARMLTYYQIANTHGLKI